MVLGAILGGFKAMMPYLKHSLKNKSFTGISRFPQVLNKLVRLHEMITRHNGLLAMLHDAEVNEQRVKGLQTKLDLMRNNFNELDEKFKYMEDLNNQKDKKLGKKKVKRELI